jgi:capsular exopolysaccharide synthesis family protein
MLALVASSISTMFQPDIYVSKTTLVTGTTFLNPNPDAGQLIIAQSLARIYADMALREPIQLATMEALGIDWLPEYNSEVVPNTQMVEISVTDTNPQRAQIIANELATQLILQSPTIGDTETGGRQEFIKQQLASLEIQIQETQTKIQELQKSLEGLTSASQIANIENEISQQAQKLDTLQTNYAGLLANSQQGAVNILSVVEPANLPTRPAGAHKLIIIVLAGLVGFSLGTGAAFLLEFLDRTIRNTTDVERVFQLPVIGYITEISNHVNKATYVAKNPNSILAENFRLLQSNIEFFRISHPLKSILITSPSQGNGKTTVASNLAVSISQEEQNVILVDADLRRPAVHRALKMSKAPGLSDVIGSRADISSVIRSWDNGGNLKVITAGNKPASITEVVGSKRISAILSELQNSHEFVIIDAPPLIIADSYNLAAKADGVIIVMEPGQTADEQARAIKEQLNRANAKIIGIVFNKVSEESAHSYDDYQYRTLYSPRSYGDYISKGTKEPTTVSRSKRLMDFFEHGKVPPEVATEVQSAITAIKTQPRNMFNRVRKSNANGKSEAKVNGRSKRNLNIDEESTDELQNNSTDLNAAPETLSQNESAESDNIRVESEDT